jgi:hypothetical protein
VDNRILFVDNLWILWGTEKMFLWMVRISTEKRSYPQVFVNNSLMICVKFVLSPLQSFLGHTR